MGTLLYFAALAGLFFLMMRFGCGAHVMGHGHGQHEDHGRDDDGGKRESRWSPPETDVDPVCRMGVQTRDSKSSVYHGKVYYFCSVEHRNAFEANPEKFVGASARVGASGTDGANSMEHHHG